MAIKILSTVLAAPGWWAVFTTPPEGSPKHMLIAAWATVEYTDDEYTDDEHEPTCPDYHEPFQAIEAMIVDGCGLSTIHTHSDRTVDWRHLVGIFGPGQYENINLGEWVDRCRTHLAAIRAVPKGEEPDHDHDDDNHEPDPKRHLRSVN